MVPTCPSSGHRISRQRQLRGEWSTGDLSVPGRWPLRLFPPPPRDGVARATEAAQVRPPPVARSGGDEYCNVTVYLQPPGVLRHRPTNRKAPAPAASAVRYPQSRTQRALATSNLGAMQPLLARTLNVVKRHRQARFYFLGSRGPVITYLKAPAPSTVNPRPRHHILPCWCGFCESSILFHLSELGYRFPRD
ncbi:hypothetical protein NEUTE1DRAFT_107006 [Neurospora tetrasperma FGSC 2508]|uniref:Uncharacterized protein n=1 Tax=Neurospora tetrasperma (strain FGSC 2508 / ATCC MYA-4615 / P0657) TaxID=510951 RepID=F8MC15_NEUT8|nr:uncharacterized protein NEUTE1DRAFT_107006 [Neurospora tetrasperma FGSC 2508]EGO60369.1 hypothetical protein NEUTE1DRAFT_107006 [Neurospora tetrasperma FGSC 2508]EGZ75657.1 hypothetical protein NEUTE2DRAFT_58078 [Neurospora tetrasperma FGSC 2509]